MTGCEPGHRVTDPTVTISVRPWPTCPECREHLGLVVYRQHDGSDYDMVLDGCLGVWVCELCEYERTAKVEITPWKSQE